MNQMRIFAFDFNGPAHLSAGLWRHPADGGMEYTDVRRWAEYARMLEEAGFDGIWAAAGQDSAPRPPRRLIS